MADDRREVLELEPEDEAAPPEEPETPEPSSGAGEDEDGGETETVFAFAGDEAAPASEGDNSVIRDLRGKIRELTKRNAELERETKPQKIEVGEKPTLESCEYDEERFETALDAWKGRKAAAERQSQEDQDRTESERKVWAARAEAYKADKQSLAVADYDEAESEVFAALPVTVQALIMRTEKPAALVYALSRSPARLEELSKLELADAAMMIGELRGKLQVRKRTLPPPDRPVRGNAAPSAADKELERLEREAERTGDRTAIRNYREAQRARA